MFSISKRENMKDDQWLKWRMYGRNEGRSIYRHVNSVSGYQSRGLSCDGSEFRKGTLRVTSMMSRNSRRSKRVPIV